jgi:hypothetical protein
MGTNRENPIVTHLSGIRLTVLSLATAMLASAAAGCGRVSPSVVKKIGTAAGVGVATGVGTEVGKDLYGTGKKAAGGDKK